ncbi:hypothetical protein ES703_15361 [subsurface metagenome]
MFRFCRYRSLNVAQSRDNLTRVAVQWRCRLISDEVGLFRCQWVCQRGYPRCRCDSGLDIPADSLSGLLRRGTCETIGPHLRHCLLGRGWRLCCPCRASTGLDILSQPGAITRCHLPRGSVGPGWGLFCRVKESNVSVWVGKLVIARCVGLTGDSVDVVGAYSGAQCVVRFIPGAGIHPSNQWTLLQLGSGDPVTTTRDTVSSQEGFSHSARPCGRVCVPADRQPLVGCGGDGSGSHVGRTPVHSEGIAQGRKLEAGRHTDAIKPGRLTIGNNSWLGTGLKSGSFGRPCRGGCLSCSSGGSTTLPGAAFKPYGNGYNSASSFTTAAGLPGLGGFTESLPRLLELLAQRGTTTRGCFGGSIRLCRCLRLTGLSGLPCPLTEFYHEGGSRALPFTGKGGP